MNRFLVFDTLNDVVEQVRQIVYSDTRDRVTCVLENKHGSVFVGGFSLQKNRFFGKAQAVGTIHGMDVKLNGDTNKQWFASLGGAVHPNVRVTGFISSSADVDRDQSVTRIIPECKNAAYCSYRAPDCVSHLGVGVKDNNTVCGLFSYSTPGVDVALGGVLNDRGNQLKIAFITPFSVFGALKYDVSMRQLLRFQLGTMFKVGTGAFFGCIDPSKAVVYGGGFTDVSEKVRVAINGKVELKTHEWAADVGTLVYDRAHLRARYALDTDSIEWIASFAPRDWVTVSLRSSTSRRHSKSVTYGWALDFHARCDDK